MFHVKQYRAKEDRMRVLLICDDQYHPGFIPEEGVKFLEDFGISTDVRRDISAIGEGDDAGAVGAVRGCCAGNDECCGFITDFDALFSQFNAVMLVKSDPEREGINWQTEDVRRSLLRFVAEGGGLVVVHSGIVGDFADMQGLIGCRFLSHPAQCPVTLKAVAEHPVTRGVEAFTAVDEHYIIEMTVKDATILAETSSDAGVMPGCFVRSHGKGCVCVITLGHNPEVWQEAGFRTLLSNAVRWCCGVQR
jgi:hypothetical protein